MLQVQGTAACLGVDALDERAMRMTRFVAPVTMLATGGAGQVYNFYLSKKHWMALFISKFALLC